MVDALAVAGVDFDREGLLPVDAGTEVDVRGDSSSVYNRCAIRSYRLQELPAYNVSPSNVADRFAAMECTHKDHVSAHFEVLLHTVRNADLMDVVEVGSL